MDRHDTGDGSTWRLDDDGIGWILFQPAPGRPPLVDSRFLANLDAAMDALDSARALVLTSPAPDTYLAGADLDEILSFPDDATAAARLLEGQCVLRRLERLPIPTVAAVRGACLGAGIEVALACAYRPAADDPATRFAFPETRHGMIPGLGGTVRLPRLVGLENALDLLLSGRVLAAEEAREMGLVDRLLPADGFAEAVRLWVSERVEGGPRRTRIRRPVTRRLLEDTAPGRRIVARRAARRLWSRDPGGAQRRALDLVLEGLTLPLDRAFEREARVAATLVSSEEARGMIHAARGIAGIRPVTSDGKLQGMGILGHGPAIAEWVYLLASRGVPVRVRDTRRDRLGETIRLALRGLAIDVRDGRISEREADRSSALISGSTGFGGFGTLEAVIVAGGAGEGIREAIRDAEEHTRSDCLICCAEVVARTADLQAASGGAERIVRVLLSPSPRRFPLVEIAAGSATSEETRERIESMLAQLGLTPLPISDSPGGAATRLLAAYLAEGMRLAAEGVEPGQVDRALEEFGFIAGPLRRAQDMGVDRAMSLLRRLAESLGPRFEPPARAPAPAMTAPAEPVRARVVLVLINEAAALLEEGVLPSPQVLDAAVLLGLGFPRSRGGLLRHADTIGLTAIADSLDELRVRLGDRFDARPSLRRLASTGGSFTGHPASRVL